MSNKNHKPIITPDLLPKISSDITDDSLKYLSSKQQQADFKKSNAYKKYVQPVLDREKVLKKQQRSEWFWNKFLPLCNFSLALIAAVTGILALIMIPIDNPTMIIKQWVLLAAISAIAAAYPLISFFSCSSTSLTSYSNNFSIGTPR